MANVGKFEEDGVPVVEKVTVPARTASVMYRIEDLSFIYHFQKITINDDVYICKNQRGKMEAVNARLRKDKESNKFRKTGHPHDHPSEADEQMHVNFINDCCQYAVSLRDPPREIFDRIRRKYPGLVVYYNSAMRKRIQRARCSVQPQIFKNNSTIKLSD